MRQKLGDLLLDLLCVMVFVVILGTGLSVWWMRSKRVRESEQQVRATLEVALDVMKVLILSQWDEEHKDKK